LGFSSDGLQGKDHLCSVPNDVACSVGLAEQGLSSQAGVKETLTLLGAWMSQVLVFGQALKEIMEAFKRFGPWKFLKSLGYGHFKRRPLRKPRSKPIFRCALKKTKPASHLDCSSSGMDAGHGALSSPDLALEAKALDPPATTFEDSCHSGCSLTSQVGAGDSPPSASVDASYGLVLGVDPRMSLEVLGSSLSRSERDVTGRSSVVEVVSGMGSTTELSFELVLEVVTGLDSSPGTIQKDSSPVFSAQPLFLSVLVQQDWLRSETNLLAILATSATTLSLTLSQPLYLYLRKVKVLKALGLWTGECLRSSSFAGITSSPPTEALSQTLAASLGKDGLCGGSTP
jgi:hypothetical protein